jgi:predicted SprT family Zn-dependent metalloprotease
MWSSLNHSYFDNRLPSIDIQWSTRLTSSVGLFVTQSGPRTHLVAPETRHGSGRVIRLSLPLLREQPLAEIRGTLAHEMIHQWQFDVKKCHPSHGREFRRVMNLMNEDGLGITIYHALTQEVEALSKYAWQCQQCGRAYHRQRKSISSNTHRCGYCRGELREVSPGTKWGSLHGDAKSKQQVGHDGGVLKPIQLVFAFMSD